MSIKVEKIEKGFAVFFPFDLKDNFKSVFKSAKWNPSRRCWEVGPRSGKKLDQWVAMAGAAAAEIEEAEAAELDAKQLESLEEEIAAIRTAVARQRSEAKTAASAEKLALAKDELARAKADLEAEKQATLEQIRKSEQLLAQVCDVDAIHEAHSEMKRCAGKVGSRYREAFNDACSVMKEQNNKLKAIGFRSVGLNELYYMNFNRFDRDKPGDVTRGDILNIVEWSEED